MAWWGKLAGGAFGFMLGGPLGALLGAVLGHNLDKGLKGLSQQDFTTMLSLHAKAMASQVPDQKAEMAKLGDKAEIDVVEAATYEFTLMYTCPERDVGAKVCVEAAGRRVEGDRAILRNGYGPQDAFDVPRTVDSDRVWIPHHPLIGKVIGEHSQRLDDASRNSS